MVEENKNSFKSTNKFQNIALSEVLFVSDIEDFTEDWKNKLENSIKSENIKLLVFVGDIFSSILDHKNDFICLFNNYWMFERFTKFCKKEMLGSREVILDEIISDYYDELTIKKKKEFRIINSFLKFCRKTKIEIIFYSGNHDCFIWYLKKQKKLDLIKKLHPIINNFYIPEDFELICLKDNFYITGIHTRSEDSKLYYSKEFDLGLKNFPLKTILISHIPCTGKFTNLGSDQINDLKAKHKFFYHIHGHCKDYYKEYLSSGIPTISVDENIVLGKNIDNKQKTLL